MKGAGGMSKRGVIAMARCIWDDPDFKDEKFTERLAFIWLVSEAAWEPRRVRGSNGLVDLKRGEFSHSIRYMAIAWGWKKTRVADFLNRLKKRDTLRDSKQDGSKVYLIKNYNKFQVVGLPKPDSKTDSKTDRIKEDSKKVIKEYTSHFETFWKAYPRKTARGAAGKAYTAAMKRATPEEIFEGVKRYAKAREGENKHFTAHASTWLNADRWLDEEIPKVVPDTRTNGSGVWIRKGSRQWLAWEQHGRRNNDDKMLFSMDCVEDGGERKFQCAWPSEMNG